MLKYPPNANVYVKKFLRKIKNSTRYFERWNLRLYFNFYLYVVVRTVAVATVIFK